ncbi:glutathione S-transferase theta-1-like [Ischnura elegans]|uniref:glutathione S-transferase theta-1-like n=1 Tax=Ischnura elegans TaxID=197161 RepID=UPI001ED874F1|nr:glutathione S-transferase theta-1-like [Ischnura elegans]
MLKVYYDLMSQPSRAVFLFLKINKIPYESCPVALRKGEHFTESFAKINPFQKVPVIDDGGFKLPESVAILRYLARSRNVGDHWYPQDLKRQAAVDEYLEWQHLNIRFNCAMYFQVKFLQPSITGIAPKPERVADFLKRMETSLDQVEKIWLQNGAKKYLTGDEISIADILGACEIEQPKMAGYDVRQNRPNLAAWMDRVRNDLSPYYDEAHDVVNKVAKRFGGNPPLQSKM